MESHFRKPAITRGKKHLFLSMHINIIDDKKIEILMKDQLQEAIDMFGEDLNDGLLSPAYKEVYTTYDDASAQLETK
eukprot:11154368-Ditylum_brightwellii.AAC.1